jgi:peptidoglycan hydrolase CwlO-like protein
MVFVYGVEINDFHTIDKAYLGVLCMGGIQELSKLNTTLQISNDSLVASNTTLQNQVSTLQSNNDNIMQLITALQNQVATLEQTIATLTK